MLRISLNLILSELGKSYEDVEFFQRILERSHPQDSRKLGGYCRR